MYYDVDKKREIIKENKIKVKEERAMYEDYAEKETKLKIMAVNVGFTLGVLAMAAMTILF